MRFDELMQTRSATTLLGKLAAWLKSWVSVPNTEDDLVSQELRVFLRRSETVFRLLSEPEKNNPRVIRTSRIRELSMQTGIDEGIIADAVELFCLVASVPEKTIRPGPTLTTVLQKMPLLSHATIRLLESGEEIAKLLCYEYVDSSHFLMAAVRDGAALRCLIDRHPELAYRRLAEFCHSEFPVEHCAVTRPASLPLTDDGVTLISHLARGLFDDFSAEGRIVLLSLQSSKTAAWRLLDSSGLDTNEVINQVRELEVSQPTRPREEKRNR